MRLTISGAEVDVTDARLQSFTLREEARSCLAALSRSTLLPVIVERHLVAGYYALKLYSFHVTHPRRKALPYVRKRDAAHTLREESPRAQSVLGVRCKYAYNNHLLVKP